MFRGFFKNLAQIFPPWLLALVFFTQLAAVVINYSVFSWREIGILLAWIPLLTIPYVWTHKKIFYYLAVVICFAESFIGICHWIILKGPLTAISLFVLSNTNFSEAGEFMELKSNAFILLLIPFIIIFVMALRKVPETNHFHKRQFIWIIVLIISLTFIGENLFNKRFVRKGVPQTFKAFISYFHESGMFNSEKKRNKIHVETKVGIADKENHVFVLILGESCNRNHMSLYGYNRNTNPLLANRKDIIVYNNVVSAYSNTLFSVSSIISESNLENKKAMESSVTLIDVFSSAGYKTFWLSNQLPLGVWDNSVFNLAQSADVIRFVNTSSNSSFESTYTPSYDEKLFAPFLQALNEKPLKKFIVIHLMGSHSLYSKRYPTSFNVFNSPKTGMLSTINEYDNSVRYNDFIVDSLFNILNSFIVKHPTSVCSAIYLSDHGENVYDEGDNCGHNYTGRMPKAISEIPFIVWLSPKFKEKNIYMDSLVLLNVTKPFVSDDLFHSILDLNSIDCKSFESKRSIFSSEYNAKRLRILEDNFDYDLK